LPTGQTQFLELSKITHWEHALLTGGGRWVQLWVCQCPNLLCSIFTCCIVRVSVSNQRVHVVYVCSLGKICHSWCLLALYVCACTFWARLSAAVVAGLCPCIVFYPVCVNVMCLYAYTLTSGKTFCSGCVRTALLCLRDVIMWHLPGASCVAKWLYFHSMSVY
jgi:hypothetical protein